MKNLLTLLERFSKSLNKDSLTKGAIIEVVKKRTQVLLNEENLTLKDGVLEITTGAAAKNELKLKEEGIRSELKEAHRIAISRILYK